LKPRVITGFGVVSALGIGRAEFLSGVRSGTSAASDGPSEAFDIANYPGVRVAGIRGFDAARFLGDKGLRSLDRLTKLLIVATRLALSDAKLKPDGAWLPVSSGAPSWGERVGIVVSNAYGSLEAIHELDSVAVAEDRRYINPARFPLTVSNSAAGYASIWEDVRALNVSISDGNCGSLDAMACADMFLEHARADALLVGGAEALTEALPLAFHRLGMGGVCIGEGAALLVLETREAALARDADVLAEVTGYGTSFVAPAPEGALVRASPEGLELAIALALADAGIAANDVDVVVSGVSGLRGFDEAELLAIGRAVGEETCVFAPKLALGETFGAGGAMGMLAALAHLRWRASSPVVRGSVRAQVRTALVTSMGYYGNAAALVMRAASE
jgi:3-oxoacyl-[acyl-carrier-protein] synthase II